MQFVQLPPGTLTLPGSQGAHSRLPGCPDTCRPPGQTLHAALPFSPLVNVPSPHSLHDVSPGADVNLSAGQSAHANALEYLPAGHGTIAM